MANWKNREDTQPASQDSPWAIAKRLVTPAADALTDPASRNVAIPDAR